MEWDGNEYMNGWNGMGYRRIGYDVMGCDG
jgi:hypothetical protein